MGAAMSRQMPEPSPRMPRRNIDPKDDLTTLRALLPELDDDGLLAVHMRFWECLTIQEIAKILGRTWDDTDKLIERSIQNLREGFLTQDTSQKLAAA
jgi:DNA-directed RNA polymerase specialized sigma24 family protein